ncbi:MAG: TIGR02281 family clan AA aspartic protease [Caulobacteraceae bacterium]|nr:TIGR02281 family clan AA aspartic protease [Caulobacteraceae bacterium]
MRRRLTLWLALLGLSAAGLGLLLWLAQGELHGTDWADAAYLFGLLALVSSGVVYARRIELGRTLRNMAIWALIALGAVTAYVVRDDVAGLALRVRGALFPAYAVARSPRSLTIDQSADGHFYVVVQADGQNIRFMIDTGASDVVLSPQDASRIGLDLQSLRFDEPSATANGVGYGAPAVVRSLAVGPIRLSDVPVSIDRAPMATSLLGMSFLRRLESFEVRGSQLILRSRG